MQFNLERYVCSVIKSYYRDNLFFQNEIIAFYIVLTLLHIILSVEYLLGTKLTD